MADLYHKLIFDGATYLVPCKNILTFAKKIKNQINKTIQVWRKPELPPNLTFQAIVYNCWWRCSWDGQVNYTANGLVMEIKDNNMHG
jgi:hypothetical protein